MLRYSTGYRCMKPNSQRLPYRQSPGAGYGSIRGTEELFSFGTGFSQHDVAEVRLDLVTHIMFVVVLVRSPRGHIVPAHISISVLFN